MKVCFKKMSRNLIFVAFLLEFAALVLSYVALVPPEVAKSKDREGYCYHQAYNASIKVNESQILPNCEQVSCREDYFMSIEGSVRSFLIS